MSKLNTTVIEKESQNQSKLLTRLLLAWPLFAVTVLVSLALAWFYLIYTIPVYESKATILIKDEKKGIDDTRLLAALDVFASNKIVENEIEVLRSRVVMREVVKKLALYAPVFIEGKLHDISGYVESPVKVLLNDAENLKEVPKVYFSFDEGRNMIIMDKQAYPLNAWISTKWGEVKFIRNNRYKPGTNKGKTYFSLIDLRKISDGYISAMDVSPTSKMSTMVVLTLKDPVPTRSEDILNEVIANYNQSAIDDKNRMAANGLSFVEERLRYVVNELDSVERAIQQYKSSRGVVDISEQGRIYLGSVQNNDQKVSEINVQLAVLDQVENYVRTKDESPGVVPSTVGLNDGTLSQLLTKMYDLEMEHERYKRTTAENNPVLVSVQNQIQKIKPSILENIETQRNNLVASRSNLTGSNERYTSMLRNIPQHERQLLDITRQQSIKNNIYTFLLQKREEAVLSFSASVADSRLIDNAQSGLTPVSPSRKKIYMMAFLVGMGIPVGFISVKELLNQKIRTSADIEALSSFPVLGEIDYHRSRKPSLIVDKKTSFVSEQFRQIRTSLSFLGIKGKSNKILVTSTSPGEGKSFVAVNLAISLAMTDKKVILVELDLRRPGLSEAFNRKGSIGMSDYLRKTANLEQIVYPTPNDENLFFIPAGEIPDYPSELISNGMLDELLVQLQEQYDYVIVETAPVGPVTDAYIVSKLCDATLFIVRYDKTLKEDLNKLEHNYKVRGLGNVAIVLNGIKPLEVGSQRYGYGYAYKK